MKTNILNRKSFSFKLTHRLTGPALKFASILIGLLVSEAALAQRYNIIDIGTLGGPTNACFFISNGGHVAGLADTTGGETHGFLWQNGVMSDLGTLGGSFSVGNFVNERGEVSGGATLPNEDQHAFVWRNGVMTDLGTLPGGTFSVGILINNRLGLLSGACSEPWCRKRQS